MGAFSDVFLAEDVFLNIIMAVKVLKSGFEPLGYREKVFLDFAGGRYPRGPCYCKSASPSPCARPL